jgi:hypothetical protein
MGGNAQLQHIVATLEDGKTLDETFPGTFVPTPVVVASSAASPVVAPSSGVPMPVPSLSLDVPLRSRRLSPVVAAPSAAPSRPGSRSPAENSPAPAVSSPAGDPLPLHSPSAGSGAGAGLPSPQGSARSGPLPYAPLPSAGSIRSEQAGPSVSAVADTSKAPRVCFSHFHLACVLTWPSQCERCKHKKKGCQPAVVDDPHGPCGLCVRSGAMCTRDGVIVCGFAFSSGLRSRLKTF